MRRRKAAFGRLQLRQRGLCARGAGLRGAAVLSKCLAFGSRWSYVSIGMLCVRLCLSCGSIGMFFVCLMPVMRSYRKVLRSITPVSFPSSGKEKRLAECCVPVPPWVEIAGSAFSNRRYGYPAFLVHFGLERFFAAIPTENEGTGERSRRRGVGAFCVIVLALPCFPRGVRWGLRAPKPAPRSH